jgi:LysM repeat protein
VQQQQPQQVYNGQQQQPQVQYVQGQQQPQVQYVHGQQQPQVQYVQGQQQPQVHYVQGQQQPQQVYNGQRQQPLVQYVQQNGQAFYQPTLPLGGFFVDDQTAEENGSTYALFPAADGASEQVRLLRNESDSDDDALPLVIRRVNSAGGKAARVASDVGDSDDDDAIQGSLRLIRDSGMPLVAVTPKGPIRVDALASHFSCDEATLRRLNPKISDEAVATVGPDDTMIIPHVDALAVPVPISRTPVVYSGGQVGSLEDLSRLMLGGEGDDAAVQRGVAWLLEANPVLASQLNEHANKGTAPLSEGTPVVIPEQLAAARQRNNSGVVTVVHRTTGNAETLMSIGHRYGVAPEHLARQCPSAGGLVEPLREGVELVIQRQNSEDEDGYLASMYKVFVERGDTASSLAKKLGIDVRKLKRANGWEHDTDPVVGSVIRLPGLASSDRSQSQASEPWASVGTVHLTRRPDETIEELAFKYGVAPAAIRAHNPFLAYHTGPLSVNRRVIVVRDREAPSDAPVSSEPYRYKATAGELLEDIATKFAIPVSAIMSANKEAALDVEHMCVGPAQILLLPPLYSGNKVLNPLLRGMRVEEAGANDTAMTIAIRTRTHPDAVRYANPTIVDFNKPIPKGTKVVVFAPNADRLGFSRTMLRQGDNADKVASRHNVPLDDVRDANPDAKWTPFESVLVPPSVSNPTFRRVPPQIGSTVASVAAMYRLKVDDLKKWNPRLVSLDPSDEITSREPLLVPLRRGATLQQHSVTPMPLNSFIATAGDTIQHLADRSGIDVATLLQCNEHLRLHPNAPLPSMQQIFVPSNARYVDPRAAAARTSPGRGGQKKRTGASATVDDGTATSVALQRYNVRDGDLLTSVAHRFGTTPAQITKLNPCIRSNDLKKDADVILLPVSSSAASRGGGAPQALGESKWKTAKVQEGPDEHEGSYGNNQAAGYVYHTQSLRDALPSSVGISDLDDAIAVHLENAARVDDVVQHPEHYTSEALVQELKHMHAQHEAMIGAFRNAGLENASLEARCRALEGLEDRRAEVESEEEQRRHVDALERQVASLLTDAQVIKTESVQRESMLLLDFERRSQRHAREVERNATEERERWLAFLRSALAATSSDHAAAATGADSASAIGGTKAILAQLGLEGSAVNKTLQSLLVRDGAAGQAKLPLELLQFLNFKDEACFALQSDLEKQMNITLELEGRLSAMQAEMHRLDYLQANRPALVKMLYDLYKVAKGVISKAKGFRAKAEVREPTRRLILECIGDIEALCREMHVGHKYIVGNFFTDAEVRHCGASPAEFEELIVTTTTTTTTTIKMKQQATAGEQAVSKSATGTLPNAPPRVSRAGSVGASTRRAATTKNVSPVEENALH